jgi:hypothetical protein
MLLIFHHAQNEMKAPEPVAMFFMVHISLLSLWLLSPVRCDREGGTPQMPDTTLTLILRNLGRSPASSSLVNDNRVFRG